MFSAEDNFEVWTWITATFYSTWYQCNKGKDLNKLQNAMTPCLNENYLLILVQYNERRQDRWNDNFIFSTSNSITIFYFNACSILPKLDELSPLCSVLNLDVVCIVESWLSADIPNLDIALPNYLSFRCDRNCYGGGIVVFVKSHFFASKVYVSPKIEFLLLSIKFNHCSFSSGTYYRPPSSSDDLDLLFEELNPSILSNLILLGDFNINFFSTSNSSSKTKMDVISDTFHLKQIVNVPTHFSHTDTPPTIDLVFLPSSTDASSCSILHPVSSSDNFSILFSLPTYSVNSPSPPLLARSGYTILLTLSVLMLSSAPLTGKNSSPCQILMLPGAYLRNLSSTLWPPLFLTNLCTPLPTLLFLGSTSNSLTMSK